MIYSMLVRKSELYNVLAAAAIVGVMGMACTRQPISQAEEAPLPPITTPDPTRTPTPQVILLIVRGTVIIDKTHPTPPPLSGELVPISLDTNSSIDSPRYVAPGNTSLTPVPQPLRAVATAQPRITPSNEISADVIKNFDPLALIFDSEGNALVNDSLLENQKRLIATSILYEFAENKKVTYPKPDTAEFNKLADLLINSVRFVNQEKYNAELEKPEDNGKLFQKIKNSLLINIKTRKIFINKSSIVFTPEGAKNNKAIAAENPQGFPIQTLELLLDWAYREVTPLYLEEINASK